MRQFTKVSPLLWDSEKFQALPDDKYRFFYIYLITCRHVNSIGCYMLRPAYAAEDLNLTTEDILDRIDTVSKADLICWDPVSRTVFINNWFFMDAPCNRKHAKHMAMEIETIGKVPFKQKVIDQFKQICLEKKMYSTDDFKIPYIDPIDTVSIYRDLTLPKPYLNTTSNLNGEAEETATDVSRGTDQLSGEACGGEIYLWEEFLGCKDVEDFIEKLPINWRGALEANVSEEIEGTRYAFCADFWIRYVGRFPGDEVKDKFPKTLNWYYRFKTHCDNYARKVQGLPKRRIIGSKAKKAILGDLGGVAA